MTIKELEKIFADLQTRVTVLEKKLVETKAEVKPLEVAKAPEEKSYPIPAEYREIIDTVLNKQFGIQIQPHSDRPSFTFTIIVPEQYSTMTPSYKEMYKYDLRPKVLNYSDGTNGVRDWATKVYENLSTEIKSQVTKDRG